MLENRIKILHLADLHLEREFSLNSIVGDHFSIRREEIWESFERALDFASDNQVEIVLIAGDIYENDNMTKSNLDRLAFIFKTYSQLRFYVVHGNHDHMSLKSKYLRDICSKNVYFFDDYLDYREYKWIRIYGYSWNKAYYDYMPFDYPELDRNYFNIMLLHGMDNPINEYLPLDLNKFDICGFDYLALGHIHDFRKVNDKSYYPGSIEPLSFNNLGKHGGILLEVSNKEISMIEHVVFASRSYHDIDIDVSGINDNLELFEIFKTTLEEYSSRDFINVNLCGKKRKTLDFEELELVVLKKFSFIKFTDLTRPNYNFSQILENNRDNIIGKYFEYVFNNFDEKDQRELVQIGLDAFPIGDIYED